MRQSSCLPHRGLRSERPPLSHWRRVSLSAMESPRNSAFDVPSSSSLCLLRLWAVPSQESAVDYREPCRIHRCRAAESIWGDSFLLPASAFTVFCALKWETGVLVQCPQGIWCPRSPEGDLGCTGGCGHCRDATRASLDCSPGFHQHRAVTGHLCTMNLEVRILCKGW